MLGSIPFGIGFYAYLSASFWLKRDVVLVMCKGSITEVALAISIGMSSRPPCQLPSSSIHNAK